MLFTRNIYCNMKLSSGFLSLVLLLSALLTRVQAQDAFPRKIRTDKRYLVDN